VVVIEEDEEEEVEAEGEEGADLPDLQKELVDNCKLIL